jgi:Domain of unknown function (DUF4386)
VVRLARTLGLTIAAMLKPPPSNLFSARVAGVIYLAIVALGLFGEGFVRGSMVVGGDTGATAESIINSTLLWRTGIATDLLMYVLDVPLIVFFYLLLKPVNHPLALLTTAFYMIQTCVLAFSKLSLIAALSVLTSSTFPSVQVFAHGLAHLAISLHGYGVGIGLVFFGFACLVRGYLFFQSSNAPKWLGPLQALAGICYLVNSFALLLYPPLASMLFPAVLLPALVAELVLSLWMIVANQTELQRGIANRRSAFGAAR